LFKGLIIARREAHSFRMVVSSLPLSPFLDIKFINIQRRKRKKEGGVRGWQKSKKIIENLLA